MVLSFFFLLQYQEHKDPSIYYDGIRVIIQLGGDTDTNACIAGGLLGALVGYKALPADMMKTTLSFDCESEKGIYRPEFLNVSKHAVPLIRKLIDTRPAGKLILDEEYVAF